MSNKQVGRGERVEIQHFDDFAIVREPRGHMRGIIGTRRSQVRVYQFTVASNRHRYGISRNAGGPRRNQIETSRAHALTGEPFGDIADGNNAAAP